MAVVYQKREIKRGSERLAAPISTNFRNYCNICSEPGNTAGLRGTAMLMVPQFADKHRTFSEGILRWYISNSRVNGLDQARAILRAGSKVLIDEDLFFAWLDKVSGIKGE